jgi:hypothetical protein
MPGQDGEDGAEGIPGAVGATGPQGATGATGPTGSVGGYMMLSDASDIDVCSEALGITANETTLNPATINMMGGAISPSFPAGIKGCTSGANVSAGSIGEVLSNTGTAVSLSTGTQVNVASITLTPGIWLLTGSNFFNVAGSTIPSVFAVGITNVSASLSPPYYTYSSCPFTVGTNYGVASPQQVVNVSSNTIYYLVVLSNFTTSTMTATGIISSVRIA